jgi:hypothetical protein
MFLNHEATLPEIISGLDFAGSSSKPACSELSLDFKSQFLMKPFRQYVGHCRSVLNDICTDIDRLEEHPGDVNTVSSITKQLGSFCMDADSWGLHSLYDIAFRLQALFLNSGSFAWSDQWWKSLKRKLAMLYFLLDQCEADYRRRLLVNGEIEM